MKFLKEITQTILILDVESCHHCKTGKMILRIKTKTGIEIEFPISALQSVMEILND